MPHQRSVRPNQSGHVRAGHEDGRSTGFLEIARHRPAPVDGFRRYGRPHGVHQQDILARAAFESWLDPANFDSAGNQRKRLSELMQPSLSALRE